MPRASCAISRRNHQAGLDVTHGRELGLVSSSTPYWNRPARHTAATPKTHLLPLSGQGDLVSLQGCAMWAREQEVPMHPPAQRAPFHSSLIGWRPPP